MIIRECITSDEISSTFSVMRQLRPHLQADNYLAVINALQNTEKYRLVGLFNDTGKCIAVAGFRVMRTLFLNGEAQLYIDDLVTDEAERSNGHGCTLLDWLYAESKKLHCRGVSLDSGMQRTKAHAFYRQQGFMDIALHFQKN